MDDLKSLCAALAKKRTLDFQTPMSQRSALPTFTLEKYCAMHEWPVQ